MTRRKKGVLNYWETAKDGEPDKPFSRIGKSFIEDMRVENLNHLAFRIYVYMCVKCKGNPVFEFTYSDYSRFSSKGGFLKAKAELIEKGFIEEVQNNSNLRQPNLYKFSTRWKQS